MRYVKLVLAALCLTIAVLFFVQNDVLLSMPANLKLDFYLFKLFGLSIPLYVLVVGAFALGVLLSLFFLVMDKIHCARETRSLRRKLKALEQEVTSLRNLPLSGGDYDSTNTARSHSSDPLGPTLNPEDDQA